MADPSKFLLLLGSGDTAHGQVQSGPGAVAPQRRALLSVGPVYPTPRGTMDEKYCKKDGSALVRCNECNGSGKEEGHRCTRCKGTCYLCQAHGADWQ